MSTFTSQFTQLSFPLMGLVRFPEVTISPEDRAALKLKPNATNRDILRALAWQGFLDREAKGWFKTHTRAQVVERFKTEFATFDKTGVVDYLLLVWDIVRWAQQQGIVTGWGRGSAGGSIVNACLGITKVDPLRYHLDFPRFLSEARMKPVVKDGVTYVDGKSAPDIDMDFQYGRRADVVRYVETKYAGRTAKISTRMELTGKMALKDTLKVYAGYDEAKAKQVSDFIEARFGKGQTLHEAREKNADIQTWLKMPDNARIYAIAMAIEGLAIGKGQHPSGVFISYEPIEGNIPVELAKERDGVREVVTSYDMETVAGLGIKVDILAVRSLDLVANTAALAGEPMESLDLESPVIYDYLKTHSTYVGLFQIEEGVTKEATVKIGPRHLTDLSAVLAISRPGAMKYIDQFAAYVKTGVIKPFHPAIDTILASTGGALIMQEQITEVCREVYKLSGVDADQVRYCVAGETMLVSKTRGWVSVNRLMREGFKGDLFLTLDDKGVAQWGEMEDLWSNGQRTVQHVEAQNGLKVCATAHHQFLTHAGWKTVHWLDEKTDWLVSARQVEYDGVDTMSASLALVVAGVLAEGYYPCGKTGVTFTAFDPEMMATFQAACREVYGHEIILSPDGKVARMVKAERAVLEQHAACGLSKSKALPDAMMGLTKETTRQFLSFLLACEGGVTVSSRQFEFSSKSETLIRQVQLLLLRFGIHSNLMSKTIKGYEDEGPYYRLYVAGYLYQRLLRDELTGLWPSVKLAQLDAILTSDRREASEGDLIPLDITRRFFWQHSHLFTTREEGFSGQFYRQNLSRQLFTTMAERSGDPTWMDLCRGQQRYLRIDSLDRRQKGVEVFDFTMKDASRPHVVANGLVIHNCIGKKKKELMQPWQDVIRANGRRHGVSEAVTNVFWDVCNASADYSFCKAHAVEYACLTASTIYYKARHPQAFYLSMLKLASDEPNAIAYMNGVIAEMRATGIQLLPPDLIKSESDFTIQDGHVRFGLSHIKGISTATMAKVASFKRDFEDKFSIFEAAKAAKVDIRTLASLIYAGCLDSIITDGSSRAKLALEAQLYNLLTSNEKLLAKRYAAEYDHDLLALIKGVAEKRNEKGKPLVQPSRMDTLRRDYAPAWIAYQAQSANVELSMYLAERALLGFSFSGNLHDIYSERIVGLLPIKTVLAGAAGEQVKMVSFVGEGKMHISAKGAPYFRFNAFDDESSVMVLLHGEERVESCKHYNGDIPRAGAIVTISGSLSKDRKVLFAESVIEQANPLTKRKDDVPGV